MVKQGTCGFAMEYLSKMKLENRKEYVSMGSQNGLGKSELMAALWMDRGRRRFTSSCFVRSPGESIERTR